MFRLTWTGGRVVLSTWPEVTAHPFFLTADIERRLAFGWLVI